MTTISDNIIAEWRESLKTRSNKSPEIAQAKARQRVIDVSEILERCNMNLKFAKSKVLINLISCDIKFYQSEISKLKAEVGLL